jgi:C4-dicarboxylate-specific signal transduction histidine kinase
MIFLQGSDSPTQDRFLKHLLARAGLILRILRQKHELQTLLEERTSALQQLAESQAKLVQAEKLAAIGQLAAGVAHEINSPLAAIQLQTQLLRRRLNKNDLQGVLSSVETVEQAGDNAKRIIESLLLYSRLSDGVRNLVSLKEVILQTERLLEPRFKNQKVQLKTSIPEVPPVMGNAQEISQIITNIVVNALDALEETPEPEVRITLEEEKGRQKLTIANNGPPLSPEIIDRLFDPFFTTKKVGSGTGLGLFISLQLAAGHHGELTAENSGDWVLFILSLPLQGVDQLQEG